MSGTKVAMAQPHSFQSGALSFMSCTSGRESSPMDENDSHQTTEFKTETKKKRFHPLRNLRRMFRRKTRRSSISADSYQPGVPDNPEIPSANLEQRSCSTSKLQEENLTQNLIRNSRLNPGLSLSHDSIFTPDRADSGLSSSDLENSSLSITVLTTPSKECPMKSQSSCSETSLLSIGSSEVELSPVRSGKNSDLDLGVTAYKLSHSAAKHKMAVKPRRNHGAPRSRRRPVTSKSPLPTTLEVSEEGATGRNSPPMDSSPLESQPSPVCDKRTPDMKTSWSQINVDSSTVQEEKVNEVPKVEDESDAKEEESANQKTESFFGRFLSRRSEKKKKLLLEASPEEPEDKPMGHFAKKFTKSNESKMGAKTPSRRQRVEPVEIPSKNDYGSLGRKDKDDSGRKISSSVSPPKSYWPNQVTSRSISPPKAVWPDALSYSAKPGGQNATVWDKKMDLSPNPTENFFKDFKNPSFVKELTDSVILFAKDETEKRKEPEKKEETAPRAKRQHSEDETPRKKSTSSESISDLKKKWNSSESISSNKSIDSDNVKVESPQKESVINIKTYNPVIYEDIHDGYENIQIIELVKQETRNSVESQPGIEKEVSPEPKKEPEPEVKEPDVKKVEKEPEVVRRTKPLILEKPKDLKRIGTPEFMKISLTKTEPKTPEEEDKTEKVIPKIRSTLVERRKSELFLLTESEEKDWKAKIKPLKKQTSFSEPKRPSEEESKTLEEIPPEKTEPQSEEVEEVVLRKKSVTKDSDEPELMKVFARRSLKVRESEKIVEDMQRSRDSDKENEILDSPKEDRKKAIVLDVEEKKAQDKEEIWAPVKKSNEVKVSVTPLKPEVASRKYVFPRYGRSLSENIPKQKEETSVLEENKLNKMKNITEITISCHLGKGEKVEETEEDTGFKRIQQRKAEWERRAQQGAK